MGRSNAIDCLNGKLVSCLLQQSVRLLSVLQTPLVFQVFTFLICMPLVLTLPGEVQFFSPACVQWHKKMGAEVSISKRDLCILQVLLHNTVQSVHFSSVRCASLNNTATDVQMCNLAVAFT